MGRPWNPGPYQEAIPVWVCFAWTDECERAEMSLVLLSRASAKRRPKIPTTKETNTITYFTLLLLNLLNKELLEEVYTIMDMLSSLVVVYGHGYMSTTSAHVRDVSLFAPSI